MEPAVDGCTVSSPDILGMAAAATVVKGEEGGACVKGVEPEVKGEGLGVGCVCCCCCCWDTAVIRGEGEVIGKGGEPTDETPVRQERKRERERESKKCFQQRQIIICSMPESSNGKSILPVLVMKELSGLAAVVAMLAAELVDIQGNSTLPPLPLPGDENACVYNT